MSRHCVALPGVVALGSNLGDREAILRQAAQYIDALEGVRVTAASGLVESHAVKPTGTDEASPNYLNAVLRIDSALHPEQLLVELNRIEAELGRVRVERWGDRTLDLDIITFAGLRSNTPTLTLPHPLAWQRPFVIVPWLQIEADARLDDRGPIADLDAAHSADVWEFRTGPLFATLDR